MDVEICSICNKVNRLCSSCWIPLIHMGKHLSFKLFDVASQGERVIHKSNFLTLTYKTYNQVISSFTSY